MLAGSTTGDGTSLSRREYDSKELTDRLHALEPYTSFQPRDNHWRHFEVGIFETVLSVSGANSHRSVTATVRDPIGVSLLARDRCLLTCTRPLKPLNYNRGGKPALTFRAKAVVHTTVVCQPVMR